MATGKGEGIASGTISSNTDTAVIAAPDATQGGSTIYVLWIKIWVSVGGTSSRLRVEDGQGGSVIARMATTSADAALDDYYAGDGDTNFPGRRLTPGNALNINTSGTGAATINYEIGYRVR